MRAALLSCCLATSALLVLGNVGCTSDNEPITRRGTTAYTVDHGDAFVVSATPEHIVIKKRVDDVDFPFDEQTLNGKAVLIHPVVDRAAEGVYSRATAVQADGDTYVIDARPLTLEEMGTIAEDDIVRIYMDVKSLPQKDLPTNTLKPEAFPTFHTLAFSANGAGFNGFSLAGFDFGSPIAAKPGVSFSQTIEEASLSPQVLADYSSDAGFALGFRGDMAFKSKIKFSGKVSGEFFHSQELESPPLPLYVPIGPVPVPVTLKGKAFVSCSAAATGLVDLTFDVALSASLSASLQVNPSGDDPSKWVTEGPWPNQASGSASVTPSVSLDGDNLGAAVACAVPRIEVHADVAGIAGPYLALYPLAMLSVADGYSFQTKFAAGVSAGALGFNTGVEVVLYTWKP